ncbi:peptidylprolyl isomerase [Verrucomicrobiota bacterium sgz303538]
MTRSFSRLLAPLGALALLASAPLPVLAQEVLDGIAAVVNDDVITFSQVRELVGPHERQIRETMKGEAMIEKIKETRLQAVNTLIDRQLILQEFKKNKFTIPEYVVEDRVKAITREEFGGDRTAFLRTLAAQGYTLDRFRQLEMEKVIVQAMRSQLVKANVVIPDAKIREAYNQNIAEYTSEEQIKLRMLVLRGGSSDADSRRKMLEEIRGKIMGGAPFEDLARMYSEDSTQEQGGDWGWINRRTLNESLAKVAFNLKPGEVSKIIELSGSYYLLFCEAKKATVVKPFTEVRDELEKKLVQTERQKAQEEWLSKLRKKAYIKVF